MSARVPLTFRIFRGDQLVRVDTLTQGVIKIGKVASAHLQIDDESVSRMHAILEIDEAGAVHLIDLGSTRGTFVNGTKVNKAKLESGDAIQLGAIRIEVTIGAPVVVAPVAPVVAPVVAPAIVAAPRPTPTRAAPTPVAAVTPMFIAKSDDELGAKSIEVAAMLGDSVIGVKHCIDPKSGKISSKTWGMFAAGTACLVASAAAFAVSVSNAAYNKGALDYWTRVQHKPAFSFRPAMLGAGYDWLAFGGFALGLVAVAAGLLRMRNEKKSPYYRIGTAPGVEQPLESAPAASFPLVAPSGDDFVFNYGAGMDGELTVDGKSTPFAELAATGRSHPSATTAGAIEVPIPARARIRVRSGQTTFLVSAVAQPRRHATPLFALENRAMSYFAGSLAVHLGLVILLAQIPNEAGAAAIDIGSQEPVAIRTDGTQKEDVPPPEVDSTGDSSAKEGAGKAMELESGAAGKPNAVAIDGHMQMKDNGKPPQLSREQAVQEAANAGFLGDAPALRGAFASITSAVDISSGLDSANVYGPLFGADGEGRGNFGYGLSGFGAGGGCSTPPCGTIGSGNYGTIGTGAHAGDGWGKHGIGGIGGPGHEQSLPTTHVGEPKGPGDLDAATIRRYIKRNVEKISYCYEHELLAHAGMQGSITVQFFIQPNGSVASSVGGGFNSTVANCVADVIHNIEFPTPRGGGGVQVNYPFTFHAAGQ